LTAVRSQYRCAAAQRCTRLLAHAAQSRGRSTVPLSFIINSFDCLMGFKINKKNTSHQKYFFTLESSFSWPHALLTRSAGLPISKKIKRKKVQKGKAKNLHFLQTRSDIILNHASVSICFLNF
jgi:hypothetical protein